MMIAITADPMLPVPPKQYGGIERIIDMVVRGLVARGHEVVLVAHADSDVPCRVIAYGAERPGHPLDVVRNTLTVGRLLGERPDVVHSFGRLAYLTPLLGAKVPKIMSYQREPSLGRVRRAVRLSRRGTLTFTGCSEYIAGKIRPLAPAAAIPNGVPLGRYTATDRVPADAPLVFLGRLERTKGAHTAIEVARRAGRTLVLAGNVVEAGESREYFDREIAPHIDGRDVRYVGPVNDEQKNVLLGGAAAFLMPIEWDEPFGIVMAEALACGTPVIGFGRGAVPEVVTHGETGFLCATVDEMVAAVSALDRIDRRACRARCESHFSDRVIVDAYERLYHDRLSGRA